MRLFTMKNYISPTSYNFACMSKYNYLRYMSKIKLESIIKFLR